MILGKARIPINPEKEIADLRSKVDKIMRQNRESVTKKTNEKLGIPEPIVYSPDLEPEQKRRLAVETLFRVYRQQ